MVDGAWRGNDKLQFVHEKVAGRALQRDWFRRTMEPQLVATGTVTSGGPPQVATGTPHRPFSRFDNEELMGELLGTGSGDPLRWSAARIEQALGGLSYPDDHMSVDCLLDAPDLLRAFVPVAHALSGIRQGLTARALDMIDQMEPGFRQRILAEAKRWDDEDDETWAV